jgi:hypothetical protein
VIAADLPPARVPYGDVRLGVLVARQVWPGNPCTGHEQVMLTRRRPAAADGASVEQSSTAVGFADLAGQRCLIWIRPGMSRAQTCKTVVHELGHWDGQVHASAGIMAPTMDPVFGPCEVP